MVLGGYAGKILSVDLTQGKISFERIDEEIARKYIGGAGLAAKLLWEETTADTEALSPQNPLLFMLGPLTGIAPVSSRYIVAGISPLTGIWGEAHAGGDWADELKHAGFDGIVIRGQAPAPVYLWVHNGQAEIRDASHLWGKDTYEVAELLQKETDARASTAAIGTAGERLVRIACIMNDGRKGRAAARCGLGALMGSKKLKAIAVRGTQKANVADHHGLEEMIAEIYSSCPVTKHEKVIAKEVELVKVIHQLSSPAKNWREATFEPGDRITDELLKTRPMHCRHCPYSHIESKWHENGERHMVWEHAGPLGAQCLIGDAQALQKAYSLCNRYGLDTVSTGGVISFGMECYEKGLITVKETGGIELCWGNHRAMLEMVKQIAGGEGFGRLLGQGVRRAAEEIGGIAAEFALHVKGLELPAHDPRSSNCIALQYATNAIGASHTGAPGTSFFESYVTVDDQVPGRKASPGLDFPKQMGRFEVEGKGRLTAECQDFGCMIESLTLCFSPCNRWFGLRKVHPSQFARLLGCVTGWDMDEKQFARTGERIFNLKRMFNVRRGISRKDDTLPPRFLTHRRGTEPNLPHLGAMLSEYYQARGWSEFGIPSLAKLMELELQECIPYASV